MTQSKLSLRPIIASITPLQDGSIEAFQNDTLRQVIKLQHEILISIFRNVVSKNKGSFNDLKAPLKKEFITNELRKNIPIRNQIIGIVIGMFTIEEFNTYTNWKPDLDRRIVNICIERLNNSLEEVSR